MEFWCCCTVRNDLRTVGEDPLAEVHARNARQCLEWSPETKDAWPCRRSKARGRRFLVRGRAGLWVAWVTLAVYWGCIIAGVLLRARNDPNYPR